MAQMLLEYNLMRFRIIHITLLAVVLFLVFSVSSSQAQDVPSQHEQDLLQLINQARKNPLTVATSLGMDADQILQDLPDLKDILIYGLPPLNFNESLYAAASAHTRDMLENGYYSHTSLDGRTFEERIRASGYDPFTTGESMGLFRLCGDAAPEKGVNFLFKRIFTDELKPDSAADRNILDDRGLKEVGISFITGTSTQLGGICSDQVSLLVADFGFSVAPLDPALIRCGLLRSESGRAL